MATNDTTNNASQTLFRFVSLRNPQLTETKGKNLGFIHRPQKGLTSYFDSYINPADSALNKFQAMERASKSFNNAGFETELKVEEGIFAEALKIGRKISKQEELSPFEESNAINAYETTTPEQLSVLWDNLMYQTASQNNFYVKEAVAHILKALHFGYVCALPSTEELVKINGSDLKAKAREARVVLPMKFFGDGYEGESTGSVNPNTTQPFTVGKSAIGKDAINMSKATLSVPAKEQLKAEGEKILELTNLNLEKDGLNKLKAELEKVQKVYQKARNKAYDEAYKEYLAANQPALDRYRNQLRDIQAQIKEGMTEEQINALYATLEEPSIPPFVFTYKDEINFGDFKAMLSLDSLKIFVDKFTVLSSGQKPEDGFDFTSINVVSDRRLQLGEAVVSITDEFDTYPEVFDKIDEEHTEKSQALYNKTPVQEQTFASLGGVLVPVADSFTQYAAKVTPRSYYLKATPQGSIFSGSPAYLTFYYQAESSAWGMASAKLSIISDVGSFEESYNNIEVVDSKVTLASVMVGKFSKYIRNIQIKIYFNNGKEASLDLSGVEPNQAYTDVLYVEDIKDETGNPGGGIENPKPGTFIPKHFGVKRLGIADYLKVEQSVHAYVPGEVSNIENVMASELRHKSSVARDYSEITDTTSESIESEKLSDTTRADRNEMQTEIAQELKKEQNITATTKFTYDTEVIKYEIGGSYANNTSQQDSTKQAVKKSQEITERAMERVLTKINKERVQKIIKEYTETNVHEFDNRGQASQENPQHITGVYRWVDKKMKNQIYNYGKRTMFEFMIPEPARLHTLATAVSKADTLTAPADPRKAEKPWGMASAQVATKDQIEYWANIYNVKLTELPKSPINLILGKQWEKVNGNEEYRHRTIDIPVNYEASSVKMFYGFERNRRGTSTLYTSNFAGGMVPFSTGGTSIDETAYFTPQNVTGSYDFAYRCINIDSVNIAFEITCKLSQAFMKSWIQENFTAIIKAYDEAYAVFLEKQKELQDKAKEEEEANKEKLGNFYREMESVILKHNCIAYLLQDYLNTLGQSFTSGSQMSDFKVILSENLEQYTALAKFMEQAFEWSIMDYTFYPYYWADRKRWQEMYLTQSVDPLFRNFLQAGMARVIVTVKPGFEDAVQFFMSTGKIWNGGEVPVIGDPLYMSIVDELRKPTGEAQGKYWITRIPTTLTILQAQSVGLEVEQALPLFPEDDPKNCENPKELETKSAFKLANIKLQHGGDTSTLPKELTTIFK
ncbi:hypothetical protein JET18_13445 [Chryseobacterium sp. L7]|uniref:Uncharacterized protein n=1 Tax=Chryseobacterium endalhagicum TaxID=2797638 RepID=A0ABS1QGZ3_9FLAO|nr:hypothetical protein [Chryseobacterium endalhagicum]MBL1221851.1 hypothetical protein [Chryseobacterium endalhagicum]